MDAAAVLQEKFPLKKITPEKYRTMGSLLMRFHLEQYEAEGLGNLCVLKTRAMLGLMNLLTVVVTPGSGKNVPFLLIDTMDMGKKHLCYVEYYDCTAGDADRDLLLIASTPYADQAAAAPVKPENLEGLKAFQQRMIREGNPSTAALTRTLGKEGAEEFFRTVVMPVP